MKLPVPAILQLRHAAAQAIRSFFLEQGFLEVDSPIRIPAPAPELHIVAEPAGDQYLRTSPELHMKRMLAAGLPAIFQLGPCFRAHEYGARHRPEFIMLEWYRGHADYNDILADMQELLPRVTQAVAKLLDRDTTYEEMGSGCSFKTPWQMHTIQEIYREHAGWDPVEHFDPHRFDLDMVNLIEPALPRDRCTVLTDYPAPVAALARRKQENPRVAERWELYAGGLELANAFSELTDPVEQHQRFERTLAEKQELGEPAYPLDIPFLDALASGLPPCAGVALGFDRLLMALTGARDIAAVLPFPHDSQHASGKL